MTVRARDPTARVTQMLGQLPAVLSEPWLVSGRAYRVVHGEDAVGRVVFVLSSHTFLDVVAQPDCASAASFGGFVVTLPIDLQLITEG